MFNFKVFWFFLRNEVRMGIFFFRIGFKFIFKGDLVMSVNVFIVVNRVILFFSFFKKI